MMEDCPFCARIARGEFDGGDPARVVHFEPLNPVVSGHRLFVPGSHREHPDSFGVSRAMEFAARWAEGQEDDFNLITSSGPAATQTIPHIHVHYVPRWPGDGLHLPWTGQEK